MSLSPMEAVAAFAFGVVLVLGIARLGRARAPRLMAPPMSAPDAVTPSQRVRLRDVDSAPDELYAQVPCEGTLLRRLAGPDRPDYWMARLDVPVRWMNDGRETFVEHVVLAARLQGHSIDAGTRELDVGSAYVVDPSLLADAVLTFDKVRYVAVGTLERI